MNEEVNIPNNLEIDKALKEFEAKNAEQKQKIPGALKTSAIPQKEASDIKFETDNWKQSVPSFQDETPKIIQLVIKYSGGAIKDEKQASYILVGFVVVAIIVSLFLVFSGGGSQKAKIEAPAGYKVIYPTDEPPKLEKIF